MLSPRSIRGGTRVRLTYEGGDVVEVDFASVIAKGGVFATLADPAFFSQVFVGHNGRALCWPGVLEFCADAIAQEVELLHSDGV